jgi:hypothetical protein
MGSLFSGLGQDALLGGAARVLTPPLCQLYAARARRRRRHRRRLTGERYCRSRQFTNRNIYGAMAI